MVTYKNGPTEYNCLTFLHIAADQDLFQPVKPFVDTLHPGDLAKLFASLRYCYVYFS